MTLFLLTVAARTAKFLEVKFTESACTLLFFSAPRNVNDKKKITLTTILCLLLFIYYPPFFASEVS
ncbi:hypothetical protein SDC9_192199 [bioreactor metagenome]|uniref:Uncharacterized protein n=1 Tax=bioreactor metagenome TaxID=1076179 RepID=A0A645I8K2_9ZZZZ